MSTTTKENFSGPAPILAAGKSASAIKFGDRKGSWSRWVVEAIAEKLKSENPNLLKSVETISTGGKPVGDDGRQALILAAMKEDPRLARKLMKLIPAPLRGKKAA